MARFCRPDRADSASVAGFDSAPLRDSLSGDYALPWLDGLALLGGVETGAYAIFNVGSRYSTRIDGYDTVFRLTVNNLFDKRY